MPITGKEPDIADMDAVKKILNEYENKCASHEAAVDRVLEAGDNAVKAWRGYPGDSTKTDLIIIGMKKMLKVVRREFGREEAADG